MTPVIIASLGLLLGLVIVALIVLIVFRSLEISRNAENIPSASAPGAAGEAVAIQLQPYPRKDLVKLQYEARRTLTTYGWVDRQAGIVRIPVERAMSGMLAEGFPVRTEENAKREDQIEKGEPKT